MAILSRLLSPTGLNLSGQNESRLYRIFGIGSVIAGTLTAVLSYSSNRHVRFCSGIALFAAGAVVLVQDYMICEFRGEQSEGEKDQDEIPQETQNASLDTGDAGRPEGSQVAQKKTPFRPNFQAELKEYLKMEVGDHIPEFLLNDAAAELLDELQSKYSDDEDELNEDIRTFLNEKIETHEKHPSNLLCEKCKADKQLKDRQVVRDSDVGEQDNGESSEGGNGTPPNELVEEMDDEENPPNVIPWVEKLANLDRSRPSLQEPIAEGSQSDQPNH